MKVQENQIAPNFTAAALQGENFELNSLKGKKILLSFFRNGGCALCNLRIHRLIEKYPKYHTKGLEIIAVFESSQEDILPFVGKQKPPFLILTDPQAKIYDLYGVENSPEKIQKAQALENVGQAIQEASKEGFSLVKQENANFFRMPADFLIDENFIVNKAHYTNEIVDHLSFHEIEEFINPLS